MAYFYFRIGNRDQIYQENIVPDSNLTVNSRVFYKAGRFNDFRGTMVGDVRFPSDFTQIVISIQNPGDTPQFATVRSSSASFVAMPVSPPYPFEIAVKDSNSDSGWAFYQLRYGTPPQLSSRNQIHPSTTIRMLSDSGTGLDPASNLGVFNKAGGWGWNPGQYESRFQPVFSISGPVMVTGFIEQKGENSNQAISHSGYNNEQSYQSSTLVFQRMRGIIQDRPAKLVAGNLAGEAGVIYYGASSSQIPASAPGSIPSPFPF